MKETKNQTSKTTQHNRTKRVTDRPTRPDPQQKHIINSIRSNIDTAFNSKQPNWTKYDDDVVVVVFAFVAGFTFHQIQNGGDRRL